MQNQVEQLFKSHYRRMYLLAAAYLHDAEAAKDTVADVFAALAEGRATPVSSSTMRCSWM